MATMSTPACGWEYEPRSAVSSAERRHGSVLGLSFYPDARIKHEDDSFDQLSVLPPTPACSVVSRVSSTTPMSPAVSPAPSPCVSVTPVNEAELDRAVREHNLAVTQELWWLVKQEEMSVNQELIRDQLRRGTPIERLPATKGKRYWSREDNTKFEKVVAYLSVHSLSRDQVDKTAVFLNYSKTKAQIRSHAQKYFKKQQRLVTAGTPPPDVHLEPSDVEQLREIFGTH